MDQPAEFLPPDQLQSEKYFHNYSAVEVDMKEVIGIVFMSLLAFILLFLYIQSNQRNQELVAQINRHASQ
jgi:uncharacterized integral membrane protein